MPIIHQGVPCRGCTSRISSLAVPTYAHKTSDIMDEESYESMTVS
jgi:hypothetical protein